MSQSHAIRVELESLCHSLLEGRLTDEQQRRLEELVRTHGEARQLYVEYINLHAALYRYNSANLTRTDAQTAVVAPETSPGAPLSPPLTAADEAGTSFLGTLGDVLHQAASFLFKSNVFSILVAVGLPGLIFLVLTFDLISQPPPERPVATIGLMRDAEGYIADRGRPGPLYSGIGLYQGQELSLSVGLLELTFANGARTLLEAPTTFAVRSGQGGFLRVGRLTATVPRSGHGFTIETPLARVVDLGTDFGVWVGRDGAAETHVFKGQVRMAVRAADRPAQGSTYLQAGQAVRVWADQAGQAPRVVAIAATPDQFVRSVPAVAAPRPQARFVHQGDVDPVTEGWRLQVLDGVVLTEAQTDPSMMAPARDGGTPAWALSNRSPNREIRYCLSPGHGLGQQTLDEAKAKGWVMRARIKVVGAGPTASGNCHCIYRSDSRTWGVFPQIEPDGTQSVCLLGQSSLGVDAFYPIPDSRNRYIDYEVRYDPATDDAEVFVDGRRIASGFFRPKDNTDSTLLGLQFGLQKRLSEARFARIEWEVIDAPPAKQSRGN